MLRFICMTIIWFIYTTSYFLQIICDLLQVARVTRKKFLLSQHPDPSHNHLDRGKYFCSIKSGLTLEMATIPIQESLQPLKVAYIKYQVLSCQYLGSTYMSICSRTISKQYPLMLVADNRNIQGQSTLCWNYRRVILFIWSIEILQRRCTVIVVVIVYFQVF